MAAATFTVISAIAAAISAGCAVLTYRLTRKTQAEAEAEELLHAGQPVHPNLRVYDHSQAVIYCALFNRSKKKAFINEVRAFDEGGAEVPVTWSDRIDEVGNPVMTSELLAVSELCHIYARRVDGAHFSSGQIRILHSLKNSPLIVTIYPWKA